MPCFFRGGAFYVSAFRILLSSHIIRKSMKRFLVLICFTACALKAFAQAPAVLNAAEIREGIQKLGVNASVLYIAAHPDDENTRLLAYLAGERKYRTGYLSITRGDGGQNLIGDEQGVELGMIRTQELLAARRIDGAEQFFTRAYDFGFSKSTEEALRIWNKELILSDVVWVIRKFRPDIIITRFPPDNRAGHGHHSASAVLAREAFDAAADPSRFTEHFKHCVQPWKAKRLLWNTFNFGSTNTTSPDQFKIDVGIYNPMLGKSYGEIASESRSMHKSQGFGVPRQRGQSFEYFTLTAGEPIQNDIMDGVQTGWKRNDAEAIQGMVDALLANYTLSNPAASAKGLVALYQAIEKVKDQLWKKQKQEEVKRLLEACAGVWLEASTAQAFAVNEDSLSVNFNAIARMKVPVKLLRVQLDSCTKNQQQSMQADCALQAYHVDTLVNTNLANNINIAFNRRIKVNRQVSDPYWLSKPMTVGSFQVSDQQMIGKPWNDPVYNAVFTLDIEGTSFHFIKPVLYKYTDPVRGELYQPLVVYPSVSVKPNQSVLVFADTVPKKLNIQFTGHSRVANNGWANFPNKGNWMMRPEAFELKLPYNGVVNKPVQVWPLRKVQETGTYLQPTLAPSFGGSNGLRIRKIEFDHIPAITYFPDAVSKLVYVDLAISGKRIGYIVGAGDFVPYCLQQMGYRVDLLKQEDITAENLRQYDAVVTGIRAYNVHEWLSEAYEVLMNYVKEGGVMLVQYNTSSQIGPVRAKISPLPFQISRNRVTEEDAAVRFIDPTHSLLQFPNKITANDFAGWVQERSVYEADGFGDGFVSLLSMNDSGEPERKGSLIVSDYGKGRFIYTGLSFFRQLPAGVPGAYRIMANLLSKPVPINDK